MDFDLLDLLWPSAWWGKIAVAWGALSAIGLAVFAWALKYSTEDYPYDDAM